MVHSAVKRQCSSLFQWDSEFVVPLVVEESQHLFVENSSSEPDPYPPDDPKALLQTLLKYLSDVELFNLIVTRLAKSAPRRTPLYLTTLCIEGVHDFFRPRKPGTDSLQLATPDTADVSSHNPFNNMPITRRDSERLTGKFNVPSARRNSPALLLSLATLISFLEPAELRAVIQRRISDSSAPHRPVACFLEFLQSGGDDVPWGKVRTMMKRSKTRENFKGKKVRESAGPDQAESSKAGSAMDSKAHEAADASIIPGDSSTEANGALEPPPSYVDIELEEGEISPNPDNDAPSFWPAPHLPSMVLSDHGAAPTGHHAPAPGIAPPPPKKKRKRKSNAARRAQVHQEVQPLELSAATPTVASSFSSTHSIASSSFTRTSIPHFLQKRGDSIHPDRRDLITF